MLHLESNSGTVKGKGRVSRFWGELWVGLEQKASSMLGNGVRLFGASSGSGVGLAAVGDDTNIDLRLVPKGTGAIVSGPTDATAVQGGAASSTQTLPKLVTAIPDNTATKILTITIPNAAHAAVIKLQLLASVGAAGAIGAFEESLVAIGEIVVVRTAGVAAVATAIALTNAGKANVAGADSTATLAYSLAAVAGGVTVANTIDIKVTIAKGGGASDNHQCLVSATVVNANASGVSVA